MPGRTEAPAPARPAAEAEAPRPGTGIAIAPSEAVRAGLVAPHELLRLQRSAGNRAVARMLGTRRRLARAPAEQRAMLEKGGKTDERIPSEAGDWVWDPFDRTLTLFTKLDGPYGGRALRITYKDGTAEELGKLDPDKRTVGDKHEEFSLPRSKALEWMRTAQGKYQETEDARKIRVGDRTTGQTLCNSNTGDFLTHVLPKGYKLLYGLDPLAIAKKNNRAGAFRTIYSHPEGPKAGDIISYGKITAAKQKGGMREAEFHTTTHIGVFKSARPGAGNTKIWTVVDGGQGTYVSRQETRERSREFSLERMLVTMPKLNEKGKAVGQIKEEMEVGILKSGIADAGHSADDKLLRGWIDLDDLLGGESAATDTGAGHRVFVGAQAPAPAAAP